MQNKPIILILCDYYLPGYKSGGGMRTVVNTVDKLQEKFDFRIITRDYDGKLDKTSYTNVKINHWNDLQGAKVFYLSKDTYKLTKILKLVNEVKPEKIYTNSFFSTLAVCVLFLRAFRLIRGIDLIVAPCGELSVDALRLKPLKKRIYIAAVKAFGLNRNIIWKASTALEVPQINRVKGSTGIVKIAPDLLPASILSNYESDLKLKKRPGAARFVFISRFVRIKNFKWLLELLPKIEGNLDIDIYAPLEDEQYWLECAEIINKLPHNVKVIYKGVVEHESISATLFGYHFFILPTLSENFGHICLEALGAGCPLVISDKTPWLELESKNIGWDLNLFDGQVWIDKLNICIDMGNSEYQQMSANARQFAESLVNNEKIVEATEEILLYKLN